MATVNIHVWHNVTGEIVAVGRPMNGAKCVPLSNENQSVIESQIDEEYIAGLHQTHFVETTQKSLVKRSDYQKKQ